MVLAAIDPLWINAVTYDAEELRRNQSILLTGGATPDTARGGVLDPRSLLVSLSGSNLTVSSGGCAVSATKGGYLTGLAGSGGVIDALQAADSTNPRRDRVGVAILDSDVNASGTGKRAEVRYLPGTPKPLAASNGDGYPAVPTDVAGWLDLYMVDMPKSGNGSPVLTDIRPYTSAAGAPVLVRSATELASLPQWNGATARRLDLPGKPVMVSDGTSWLASGSISGAAASITGFATTGTITLESVGSTTRLSFDVNLSRTGTGLAINGGGASETVIGNIFPTNLRLGGRARFYAVEFYGGGGMNQLATAILDGSGNLSLRGNGNAFTWVTGAAITLSGTMLA